MARINFESNKEDVSIIRQYSKIRYDKKLNQEIDVTLRKYNNKIERLKRKDGYYMLHSKISKDDLMETSWTRADLRRRLSNLRKFNERGAEKVVITKSGYAISKYEMDYLKQEKTRVKRNIQKSIKFYETTKPKLWGKETARTFAQMGDTKYLNLIARLEKIDIDVSNLAIDELYDYRHLLDVLGRNKDYLATEFQLNYMKILDDIGQNANYDEKKLEKIKKELMKIDPSKFYDLYINEKSIKETVDWYHVFRKGKDKIDDEDVTNNLNNLLLNIKDIVKDYK